MASSSKLTTQPKTPRKPYVRIKRLSRFRYSAEIINPDMHLNDGRYGIFYGFERAKRQGEKELRRYLRKKGYQEESWTLTVGAS